MPKSPSIPNVKVKTNHPPASGNRYKPSGMNIGDPPNASYKQKRNSPPAHGNKMLKGY